MRTNLVWVRTAMNLLRSAQRWRLGLSPGLYRKFGVKVPIANTKQSMAANRFLSGCSPPRLNRWCFFGKLGGSQVIPGHETSIMRSVGGDVKVLEGPGRVSFRSAGEPGPPW